MCTLNNGKIDHVFFINLERRKDRLVEIESELNKNGIIAERFNACTHATGAVGCANSHLEVLKLAKSRNYENVLILEDDFQFLVSKEEFEMELSRFFTYVETHPYDVCMFSYNLKESSDIEDAPYLKRVLEAQTASGYLVNRHYYDKLITLFEWANPLLEETGQHWVYLNDQVWKRLQRTDNWVCFNTRLGKQRPGYSDNGNAFTDYGC